MIAATLRCFLRRMRTPAYPRPSIVSDLVESSLATIEPDPRRYLRFEPGKLHAPERSVVSHTDRLRNSLPESGTYAKVRGLGRTSTKGVIIVWLSAGTAADAVRSFA